MTDKREELVEQEIVERLESIGVDVDQAKRLADLAKQASRITGIRSEEAFENLIDQIERLPDFNRKAIEVYYATVEAMNRLAAQRTVTEKLLDRRAEQDREWGPPNNHPLVWVRQLIEELGEASKAEREGDRIGVEEELLDLVAVGMSWLEQIEYEGRNKHIGVESTYE